MILDITGDGRAIDGAMRAQKGGEMVLEGMLSGGRRNECLISCAITVPEKHRWGK